LSTELAASAVPVAPLRFEGTAYGLAIRSDARIDGLTVLGTAAGERAVELRTVTRAAIEATCPEEALVRRGAQGADAERVTYFEHGSDGLLMRTESFGDHLIADGGRRVLMAPGTVSEVLWHRYVCGQVLPLAASLQGLEVLHAAAVSVSGRAVALAGASGAGKSSIATRLLVRGARLLADDVIALELSGDGLLACPGPAVLRLCEDQERLLAECDRARLGPLLARQDKAIYGADRISGPLPLGGLYVLRRDAEASGVRIEPLRDVRLLFACTYDGVTRGAERSSRLLDTVRRLMVGKAAHAVHLGPDSTADDAALAVLEHAEGTSAW
jgi:HPr Serine kinase C-terminal domain